MAYGGNKKKKRLHGTENEFAHHSCDSVALKIFFSGLGKPRHYSAESFILLFFFFSLRTCQVLHCLQTINYVLKDNQSSLLDASNELPSIRVSGNFLMRNKRRIILSFSFNEESIKCFNRL